MNQVEVEITGQAITARYGTLNTGHILRTDAAFARHLVEDCSVAKYTNIQKKPLVVENKQPAKARSTKKVVTQPTTEPDIPE